MTIDHTMTPEALNKALGSSKAPISKPIKVEPVLDDYTLEQLEDYAASAGLTLDQAVARWLKHSSVHCGWRSR